MKEQEACGRLKTHRSRRGLVVKKTAVAFYYSVIFMGCILFGHVHGLPLTGLSSCLKISSGFLSTTFKSSSNSARIDPPDIKKGRDASIWTLFLIGGHTNLS